MIDENVEGLSSENLSESIEDLSEGTEAVYGRNENTCICCGDSIPEGRQVCPDCECWIVDKFISIPN